MTNIFIDYFFTLKYGGYRKDYVWQDFFSLFKENLIQRKQDIVYLTGLFAKCNEVNLQLQGDNLNLIKTKSFIAGFLVRINLMKQNVGRREFSQFPKLSLMNCHDDGWSI